ncbi:hypothetical protein ACVIHH_003625 [Bradyrhizobium sp. USDA 4518]
MMPATQPVPLQAVDMPGRRRLELLLLCDFVPGDASTIIDHVMGLKEFSRHTIRIFNAKGDVASLLELDRFDGVIVHYSLAACMDSYIGSNLRAALSNFKGLKAAFIQDEYRWIDETTNALRGLGIHILFSVVPPEIMDDVYPPERLPGVVRETLLTGYVPAELLGRAVPSFEDRSVDVGYRARKLPVWLGSFAREKWLISDRFEVDAARYDLTCDMSTREEDRIYGEGWIDFLSNCKAVLGTESGSSICDFTGEIQRNVERHLARDAAVTFETLRDLYFKDLDGQIVLSVISPRCFEAAALRTLMILYEGRYSGRLEPWRHYVPLKKDHSNMVEVVEVLRDRARAQEIIDRAYREVALNPDNSFEAMVGQVDRAIDRVFELKMAANKSSYTEAELAALCRKGRRRDRMQMALRRVKKGLRNPIDMVRIVTSKASDRLAQLARASVRRKKETKSVRSRFSMPASKH